MDQNGRVRSHWGEEELKHTVKVVLKCTVGIKNPDEKLGFLDLGLAYRTLATLDSAITGVEGAMPGHLQTRSHPDVFKTALTFWDYHYEMLQLRNVEYIKSEIKLSTRTVPAWLYHADLLADILQHCNALVIREVKKGAPCDASVLLTVLELMDDGNYDWLCWNKTETLKNAMQKPDLRERYNHLDPKFFKHLMLKSTHAQGKRPRPLFS
jgi:hypothetical protein